MTLRTDSTNDSLRNALEEDIQEFDSVDSDFREDVRLGGGREEDE